MHRLPKQACGSCSSREERSGSEGINWQAVPECHLSEHASLRRAFDPGSALPDWVSYARCCGLLHGDGNGGRSAAAALREDIVKLGFGGLRVRAWEGGPRSVQPRGTVLSQAVAAEAAVAATTRTI